MCWRERESHSALSFSALKNEQIPLNKPKACSPLRPALQEAHACAEPAAQIESYAQLEVNFMIFNLKHQNQHEGGIWEKKIRKKRAATDDKMKGTSLFGRQRVSFYFKLHAAQKAAKSHFPYGNQC